MGVHSHLIFSNVLHMFLFVPVFMYALLCVCVWTCVCFWFVDHTIIWQRCNSCQEVTLTPTVSLIINLYIEFRLEKEIVKQKMLAWAKAKVRKHRLLYNWKTLKEKKKERYRMYLLFSINFNWLNILGSNGKSAFCSKKEADLI